MMMDRWSSICPSVRLRRSMKKVIIFPDNPKAINPSFGFPSSTHLCGVPRNDYFSSSMSFSQIPDSLRNLTQCVTPVNHRCYLFGFNELFQDNQVLFVGYRYKKNQALAHEP